ncbi:MAG: reverse transcriptase domain-containing protein, partial [Candidatus Thiodiazotropha sp.]
FQAAKTVQEEIFNLNLPYIENEMNNLNSQFTIFELNHALSSKHNSAPGADTVSYEMLKQLPDSSKMELIKLINSSWEKGEVPADWKIATVIPIMKPHKDKLNPQSYRPISLTSAICKTMETMVANRLTSHLEKNGHLSNNQSGFRKNRSTIDQLVRLESEINMAFMENKCQAAVTLDLEKAFDLMWTSGTLIKLNEFGINGHMFRWIHNFLSGRKIQVRVGDKISDQHDLENGCPQGSVLSPILFNVIINTLDDALGDDPNLSLSQFADDSALWTKHSSPKHALNKLQQALNTIELWSQVWGFKISTIKTKAIIFTKKRLNISTLSKLTLFNSEIEFSDEITFLGMILDSKLTWGQHIKSLIEKCNKDLNLMRMVSGTTYGADKKVLLNLYKALILSKLDYGAQAYNSAPKHLLSKLDLIQNKALRIATRAFHSTPINALEVECGIKPLKLRREELILKYWARSSPLGQSLPINNLIADFGCLTTKRAPRFNPYTVTVRKLLKEHNLQQDIQSPNFMEKWDLTIETPSLVLKDKLGKKTTNSDSFMKENSLNHITENYPNKINIYTDGSKDPIANTAGAAFVIPERNYVSKIKLNPALSVFTTELIAIEHALIWILENRVPNAVILTDSLSSIQALKSGKSRTRPDKVNKILSLLNLAATVKFKISMEWIPAHVGINGNEMADSAAKAAMTTGTMDNTKPSKMEIYPLINEAITKKWQNQWSNSTKGRMLHFIQPVVKTQCNIYSPKRRYDVVYSRLRLGHCGLGCHHYGNQSGLCPYCNDPEDLDHI